MDANKLYNNQIRKIYTVVELTKQIKSLLTENYSDIWVGGEVSNYKKASSGHIYFTLKDESSVLKAALFRGYQRMIKFDVADGLKVIAHGNLDVFDKKGEYQLIVDFMEPEGVGDLQMAFEKLKQKLREEGLFEESRKKDIPVLPESIGVITSPTGAALRDILNITARRYKGVRIVIYPVPVQGEGAAEEIAGAVKTANTRREVDVLIVGRGGGSIEDLWAFNEEIVAREIYASKIPVISAVGHEIDFTISDFVADLRAPTPSAAAELVVQNRKELVKLSADLIKRLYTSVNRLVIQKKEKVSFYSIELMQGRLNSILAQKNFILDDITKSMVNRIDAILSENMGRFEKTVGRLDALSPLSTISRGFAVVLKIPGNKPVFSVHDVAAGDNIKTRLRDGVLISKISGVEEKK